MSFDATTREPYLRRHSHSGPYGTDDWLRSYGEHLELHAAQIRRNGAAWKNR